MVLHHKGNGGVPAKYLELTGMRRGRGWSRLVEDKQLGGDAVSVIAAFVLIAEYAFRMELTAMSRSVVVDVAVAVGWFDR